LRVKDKKVYPGVHDGGGKKGGDTLLQGAGGLRKRVSNQKGVGSRERGREYILLHVVGRRKTMLIRDGLGEGLTWKGGSSWTAEVTKKIERKEILLAELLNARRSRIKEKGILS